MAGYDLQELQSRVERLEAVLTSPACMGDRGTGIAEVGEKYYAASSFSDSKPMTWQAEEPSHVPPLFNAMLGLAPGAQITRAQSKSWTVVPDPLIQNVFWSDGRAEEYFRLQNQLVTLTRFVEAGTPTAVANYTATVVASGRAKPDPNIHGTHMVFNLNLQNAQGGFLREIRSSFAIGCRDNRHLGFGGRFPPDLYDVADRFHFFFSGDIRLVHC